MKDFDKNPPSKKKQDPREIEEKHDNKQTQPADEFDIACDRLFRDIDKNANEENKTEIEIKEKKIEKKKDKKIEVLKNKEKDANENGDDSEDSENLKILEESWNLTNIIRCLPSQLPPVIGEEKKGSPSPIPSKPKTTPNKVSKKNGPLNALMTQIFCHKNVLVSFEQYGYNDGRQTNTFIKMFKEEVLEFAKERLIRAIIKKRLQYMNNVKKNSKVIQFLFFHIIGEMLHRKKIREQYYADEYLLSKLIKQISSPSAIGGKNENDENIIIEREVAEEKPQDLLTAFIDVCKFTLFAKYNEHTTTNKIADESYKKNFTEALIDFGSLLKKLIEQGTIITANLSEEQKKSIHLIINDASKWAESFILPSYEKSKFLLKFFTKVLFPARKLNGGYKYLAPVVTQKESHETNVTTIGTGSLTSFLLGNCGDPNGTTLTINQSYPNPTGSYSGINQLSTDLESPPVTANPSLYFPVSSLDTEIVDFTFLFSPPPVPISSGSDAIQNTMRPSTPPEEKDEEKDKKKTPLKRKMKQGKKSIEGKNVKKMRKNPLQENKKNKSNNNSETESKNAPSISKNNMFRQPPSSLLTGNVLTAENKPGPFTTFQFFNDPNLSDELNNPNNINNKGNANNLNINKI